MDRDEAIESVEPGSKPPLPVFFFVFFFCQTLQIFHLQSFSPQEKGQKAGETRLKGSSKDRREGQAGKKALGFISMPDRAWR